MSASILEIHLQPEQLVQSLRQDVRAGMTSEAKWLDPKWFYDARGSELFEQITRLPEYYPTRTERSLLQRFAPEIAQTAAPTTIIELGSGSSEKTRLLLDASSETIRTYVPQDVSVSALEEATRQVSAEYPEVTVHGIVSDFTDSLHYLPQGDQRMIAFLGGTLGNMVPDERAEFLARIADVLHPGEHLLLGVGLVTDPQVLVRAYDDAAGVTAEFNRNILHVLNSQLGADFPINQFRHVAFWDDDNEWIEMRLQAEQAMSVDIADLDLTAQFEMGDQIRTEISAKFTVAGIRGELGYAGFTVNRTWTDADSRFALVCAVRR